MVKEGVTGLVIDLRSNGGGSLEEVRLMTGFFTGKGPVVQIKDSQNRVETKASWDRRKLFDGQVVVLDNKASASASEILAAALQDYGRAVIVGDTSTFGKGSVQQPLDMARFLPYFSDGSRAGMLKITTQKFYRVAGGSTQLKGVESDIVLPTALSAVEYGESKLDHAMPYDEIQPSRSYTKDPWVGKILPFLKERSGKRVAADRDFAITQETIARVKKLEEENKTSLNMEIRKQENKDLLDRRAEIDKERKVRFAEMAQSDAAKFKLYRMTLDDLKLPQLPQSDPKKDNEQFMKLAEDPEEKLVDTPTYPSGLDPELRECLNIVSDMVLLKENKELPPVK
jgi:carboxyl-terminal processing protease